MTADRAVAFAPGRVNLIGEHTDYNGGLALPFAIAAGATAVAVRSELADPVGAEAAAVLADAGVATVPAMIELRSDIPAGAGLASSAAVTVATVLALLALSGREAPDPVALARLCQAIEHRRGARTGLLDQLASLCARRGHAVLLDFATLRVEPVPLMLPAGWRLVILDSGDRHDHATAGGYNERRAECERACELLGVDALAGADARAAATLPSPLRERALHVIDENARVRRAVAALRAGSPAALAGVLDASHASLRDLYGVSTPALERTRERLLAAGAAGARLIGGGFGGSVLGLMPPQARVPARALQVAPCEGARVLQRPA